MSISRPQAQLSSHPPLISSAGTEHNQMLNSIGASAVSASLASSDFVKTFLKKDLQLQRLSVFDEKPLTFNSWKSSFKSVVDELDLTSKEEVDLLINHLGSESKNYAKNIAAASATSELALNRIWSRLEDRFASPEQLIVRISGAY